MRLTWGSGGASQEEESRHFTRSCLSNALAMESESEQRQWLNICYRAGMSLGCCTEEMEGDVKISNQPTHFPGQRCLCIPKEYLPVGKGSWENPRRRGKEVWRGNLRRVYCEWVPDRKEAGACALLQSWG